MQTLLVEYDADLLRQDFLHLLDDFGTWLQGESIRDALGKDFIRQVRSYESQIRARLEGNFQLVVVGSFKRGKSSLINALVGAEVATTNVTPETVTINRIQYGPEHRVTACLDDGGRVRLDPEKLQADQLVPILEKLPRSVAHIDIETPQPWLTGIFLVDTPGLGDLLAKFDRSVYAYLARADAVIVVISAASPLSEQEQAFLRLNIAPQDFPKLTFVVNMLDIARTAEEGERLVQSIATKLARIFPEAPVFGVSALDEICRTQGLPRLVPERTDEFEERFARLRSHLEESVLLNRDLIQFLRTVDQCDRMLQEFESSVGLLREALQSDRAKLSASIAQCEDQSSKLYTQIREHKRTLRADLERFAEEAATWMDDLVDRLERGVVANLSTYEFDDIQRHFHFFVTEAVRTAFSQCLEAHQEAIAQSANRAGQGIFQNLNDLTQDRRVGDKAVAGATFGDLSWQNFNTLDLVLDLVGIDKLIQIASYFLATSVRKSDESAKVAGYQKRIQEALPELRSTILQEVRTSYSQIATVIEQKIDEAYQRHIEANLAAMRQAQELGAQGTLKVAETGAVLEEILQFLGEKRSEVAALKKRLE